MEGTLWDYTYVGFFDRMDPNGKTWPGAKSITEVIERLKAVETTMDDQAAALPGWSLDPIYYDNERVTREHLTRSRPAAPSACYTHPATF